MTITLTNDDIPATMRRIRMELGLTQAAVARMLFMSSQALYYWECGTRSTGKPIPQINRLTEWANVLGYDLSVTLTPKETPRIQKDTPRNKPTHTFSVNNDTMFR